MDWVAAGHGWALGRLTLRWRRPDLHWVREGEVCGTLPTASNGA